MNTQITHTKEVCRWRKMTQMGVNRKTTLYDTSCGYYINARKVPSVCPRCGNTTCIPVDLLSKPTEPTEQVGQVEPTQKVKPVRSTKRKKRDLSQVIQLTNEERVLQTTNNINENMPECVTKVQAIESASYWQKLCDDQHEKDGRLTEAIIETSAKLLSDLILSDVRNSMSPSDISTILDRVCAQVRIDVQIAQHKRKR